MAAHRYKSGVFPILLLGIERPGLAGVLAERGLKATSAPAGAMAALVSDALPRPLCPLVIEASSSTAAGELLDGGVDDVVLRTDPDSLVAARIAAVVRRLRSELVQVGDIVIDTVERRVTRAGRPVALLPREYALLLFLARHAGEAVNNATLHGAIWPKLGPGNVTVTTERGRGYRLGPPIAAGGPRG